VTMTPTDIKSDQLENGIIDALLPDQAGHSGEYLTTDGTASAWGSVSGGSGDVATDEIWAAKGDLAIGTANDAAAILSVGTDDYVLTADSSEALGVKWAAASGGTAGMVSDGLWSAAGDIAYGTADNAGTVLPIGSADQILRVNSGETAPEWASIGRVLIDEATPSSTDTVTFSSIPQSYKTLRIIAVIRSDRASYGWDPLLIQLNSDTTAANYRTARHYGGGSTVHGGLGFDGNEIAIAAGATSPTNSASTVEITIPFYAQTTFNKQVFSTGSYREDASSIHELVQSYGVEWENTNAISSIALVLANGNYVTGSTVTLYGEY